MRTVLRCAFGYAPTATSVTWTDISPWLDLKASVRIARGASDELSQTQASTMALTLDNEDGRFSPGLASSPYYPYIRPNCPIQMGVLTGGKNLIQSPAFEDGETTGWAANASEPPLDFYADSTRAHSGTQSMLIEWIGAGTGGIVEQTVFDLTVGQTYTLSSWVWIPLGHASVRWRLDDGTLGTSSGSTTAAWTQITLTFTATSVSHTIGLTTTFSPPSSGTLAWLDDVQLETGASVTSFDSAGSRLNWRFYGMVNDWKASWAGLQPTVTLTATDLFKHLSKLPRLGSLLEEEIQLAQPIIYYPLTEPSTSGSAGDVAGTGGGSLVQAQVGTGGAVTFGQQAGPEATGATAVMFAPASASDGVRLDADLGPATVESTTVDFIKFECWFQTSTAGRQFYHCRSETFQYQIALTLNGSGYLTIEHTAVGGARTASVVNATNLADGAWHHVLFSEHLQEVYIDGGTAISVSIPFMAALRYMTIGGNTAAMWNGSVAHAVLYTGTAFDNVLLAAHYDAGANGFSGETSDDRVLRLAGYAGIAAIDAQGDFSPVASQGAGGSSALEMMRVVETTEGGKLFSHRNGHALIFQSRTVRYNAPTAVSLAFADLETQEARLPIDDQKQVNQLTAMRPGGATQRIVSSESVAAFGPYPKETTMLKITDVEVVDAASWVVSRYAVPQPELREIPVQAYSLPLATYQALLDADISSVIEITGLPDEAPAPTTTAGIEGYVEQIGQASHAIQFHTSRAQTDAVWALSDTTYSVLGTTTRLAY